MRTVSIAVVLSLLVGCAQTRTYQVSVKNDSGQPITIGLVKEGGPFEAEWASPEEAAVNGHEPSPRMWVAVPPGKVADTGPVQGKFDEQSGAYLRVYAGKLNLSQILSVSRGQPNRLDILLHAGKNFLTVIDRDGTLIASPSGSNPGGQIER